MKENAYTALRRYEAMAGMLEGIPDKVAQQAAQDRETYGAAYLSYGADGTAVWSDVRALRFLVEVCGLPLKESRAAVIENGAGMETGAPARPAADMAAALVRAFGHILEAREQAALWQAMGADDPQAADYWRAVVAAIETERFAPEDTGIENWAEGNA